MKVTSLMIDAQRFPTEAFFLKVWRMSVAPLSSFSSAFWQRMLLAKAHVRCRRSACRQRMLSAKSCVCPLSSSFLSV